MCQQPIQTFPKAVSVYSAREWKGEDIVPL